MAAAVKPRMREIYEQDVTQALQEKFQFGSPMQIPRPVKVVINMGLGRAFNNPKIIESALEELGVITGQKAVPTKARRSISNFKLREDMPIGVRVTLRGDQMYEFLDRLVTVSMPRVRDFKGISDKGFDGRGNYTLGVKEQIIFPEISIDKVKQITGMDITFVTSAQTDEEGLALLKELGMPFRS